MNLDLFIAELVLEGIEAGQEASVLAALETELHRRFGNASLASIVSKHIDLPSIEINPPTQPSAIGQQICQAIYEGVLNAQ